MRSEVTGGAGPAKRRSFAFALTFLCYFLCVKTKKVRQTASAAAACKSRKKGRRLKAEGVRMEGVRKKKAPLK